MRLYANDRPFDALCFGGGSIQTMCYLKELACIERLLEARVCTHIKHFAGSSAGCLIAMGLAAGMTSMGIADAVAPIIDAFFKPQLTHAFLAMGLDDTSCMEAALRARFVPHGVDLDMTIAQFEAAHGVCLYLYAVDAERQEGVMMPKHATLMQAFRCSSAIPLVYVPAWFENVLYVDGSFLNCGIPLALPKDQKWLWMRVKHSRDEFAGYTFSPDRARERGAFEKYLEIVLGVVRSPAESVVDMPAHVHMVEVPADPRVPFIIPRMDMAAFKAMFSELFLHKPVVVYELRGDEPVAPPPPAPEPAKEEVAAGTHVYTIEDLLLASHGLIES